MKCPACGAVLVPADAVCGECGAPRPRLVRAFADAAPRFAALAARNESGELDAATHEAEFQELLVEDDEGGYWMFEANEGEWYRYESEQWTRRDPPLSNEPEHPPLQETPPLLPPQYAEAKQRFAALSARYEAGELDDATYETEFQELLVEDDAGNYWMFSANDGEWSCHSGEEWIQRDPPLAADLVEAPMVQATSPGEVKPQPAEPAFSPTTKPSPATPTTPEVAAPSAPVVAPGSEGMICHTCGKQNPLGTRFCTSCGSNLTTSAPTPEPPPSVPADLSAATPTRRRSLWVVLLMPIGWAIAWALSGGIGAMLSPWPSPVSAIVMSLTIAGAIAGLITGLMLKRTGLPLTLKVSFAVAVRFAISWTIGWILGWGVLVLFYGAISGLFVQTVILPWAGIWGVTGTIAGIAAGAIVTVSLGRLLRRTGQSIEGMRVLTVAVGYPLGWVLGWATGGTLGAAIGAAVAGGTGAEAGGAIGGAIAGAICSGVLLRRLR